MRKIIGVLALSVAIPVLNAGVYNFSTLHHEGSGSGSITHDSSSGDHKGDSHTGNVPNLVGGDNDTPNVAANAPEPGFYGLLALGLAGLALFQLRKRRQA
ncbi:MAG TPA: PEP-CTERM sorting domain-containing protein [Bryobacteraceae bacterium]|nr:PEP-CTERM sorting domain-containing protein [Bryobacteraceae bacterium]